MPINLGAPAATPNRVLSPRRPTRKLKVGKLAIGGDAPITVQSMTTTPTSDINATLQQIAELTAAGCDIVRVAVPSQDDADALSAIAAKSKLPVVADIHFQPRYVFAAIEAGCAKVRVNPGTIKAFDDKIADIAKAATEHGTAIRIGVNAGSLDPRLREMYETDPAGALIDPQTLTRAAEIGLDPARSLADNDSTGFFEALGDLLQPGPTLTNVNDFRAILIG